MNALKRLWQMVLGWFGKRPATANVSAPEPTVHSIPAPLPKEDSPSDMFKRAYGKYKKFMRKRGMMVARQDNFMRKKHHLHAMHFGTFSPMKLLKIQMDVSNSAVIHQERLRGDRPTRKEWRHMMLIQRRAA
jgi:hypothetical protein